MMLNHDKGEPDRSVVNTLHAADDREKVWQNVQKFKYFEMS